MKKTGVLLKAPPLGSLQWEQLSVLSLFLSVPSASWQAQTAGMRGCSVLLFAGLQGCERLVPCCCCWWWWCRCWLLSWGLNGLDYTTVHCTALLCNAMRWLIVVSPAPWGKRSRSLAPQQGMAATSCVWCDGYQMASEDRGRVPCSLLFLSLAIILLTPAYVLCCSLICYIYII